MKNGKCGKCGSAKVVRVPGSSGMYGHIRMGFGLFGAIRATRYVCSSCGYMEEWIDSADDVKRLAEKFGKAGR